MAITKEEYPVLYEQIQKSIKYRLGWLEDAVRASVLCESLPEEVKQLKITDIGFNGEGLSIVVSAEEGTVKLLKTLGIQGLTPKVSSWSKKHFWTSGKGLLSNGTSLYVEVQEIEEPEGCVIEERTTTSKEFVLVCPQTGEEIK